MKKGIILLLFITMITCILYTNVPEVFPNSVLNFVTSIKKEMLEKFSSTKTIEVFDLEVVEKEEKGEYDANYFIKEDLYYPYYQMLNEREKIVYIQIYNEVLKYTSTFSPEIEISIEEVNNALEAVFNDHPELFYLDTSYSYRYNENRQCLEILLSFNETIKTIEESNLLFKQSANQIIENAMLFSSNLEKEQYVYETLMELIEYDTESKINQSAYSALVYKKSVCAGYARAFQYIMMQLKIPCYYVQGFANENHAWNIVYIDNQYYNVDLTWDDSFEGNMFFNKSDVFFNKTHTREGLSVYLPNC